MATSAKGVLTSEVDDEALREAEEIQNEIQDPEIEKFAYLLSNLRQKMLKQRDSAYTLFAPPRGLNRLVSVYKAPMRKRDGRGRIWIWMPAHGYVSVPSGEVAGANAKGGSSNIPLRYG
ncbi:hypothetical protein FSP39_006968 [Pinctada imbricata]|uniref:Uncharacterized protein n=1 Tax=Pinctada imbricata TaxID=66713 RepID=A0AA88YVM1_PINIB|nr:hypothetical protein FSP39_006968 [Pinctada imbricata]